MTTKLIVNRAAVTRSLASSVDEHGDAIAAPLEERLFPEGAPADLTVATFIRALAAAVLLDYEALARADVELAGELADDVSYRDERDAARAHLRVTAQRGRAAIVAGHGEQALAKVGLAGELPENPDQLAQLARSAADRIETADLGPALLTIDRAAVASQLRDAASRVVRAHDEMQREDRESQAARTRRDEADAKLRRLYSGLADAFAGFAYVVGRDDVASRVRPTARRRAGLPEAEDVVTEPVVAPAPTDPSA